MATDYEQKYKEALERARKLYNDAKANEYKSDMEDYESIFPELAESEDDRIRRKMLEHFRSKTKETWCNIPVKDIIAYLEKQKDLTTENIYKHSRERMSFWNGKQKEQKPAEWNDTGMKEARANLISVCMDWERGKQTTLLPIVAVRARYFLEHLTEPKPVEWSEEDEDNLCRVIRVLEDNDSDWKELSNWLKSLRPSWKPSEEQMEAFKKYIEEFQARAKAAVGGWNNFDVMIRLYEQLKKL